MDKSVTRKSYMMLVTSIKPLFKSVRLSGTYNAAQRVAELPDDGNIPRIGDLIRLSGTLEKGEYHRKVLKADSWKLAPVTAANVFEYIRKSKDFKALLTQKQLRALSDKYEKYPKKMMVVMGGSKSAELAKVVECSEVAAKLEVLWADKISDIRAVQHLANLGLNSQDALAMVKFHRIRTNEVVDSNPYSLAVVVGFDRADNIATTKYKLKRDDPRRLAALGSQLSRSLTQETGSSLFKTHEFNEGAMQHGVDAHSIIYQSKLHGSILTDGNWLISSPNYQMETKIRSFLTEHDKPTTYQFYDYEIERKIDLFENMNKPLHQLQRDAVKLAMHHSICCIQGAAGTGKTEVINAIAYVNSLMVGSAITATALSSIAVDRIKQATGLEDCYTIAKLKSDLMLKQLNIPEGSVLVVDESSMLSVQDMYTFATLGLHGIRIIFTGDNNQLAPIGYGAFFKQAVAYFPTVTLTKIWRAAAQEITGAANAILSGERPDAQGAFGYLKRSTNEIVSYAVEEGAQVIAATNRTVTLLNHKIQAQMVSSALSEPLCSILNIPFYVNDRVIFTKNVNNLGIYNGQFANLKWKCDGKLIFHMDTAEGKPREILLSYSDAINAGIQLGYCVTGHKSQGAGFDKVVVVMENLSICNKNWAYTAITRAKLAVKVAEITPLERVMSQPIKKRTTQRMVPLML
ncbi:MULTISPECIES: ATP-dependent RecD-like DNA helicase [unclassified Pseudoalteromonas]|uniref:AAA family ATPase n=1 Tax=unclassified Pseudoalteromonas TaxID=194690 RepID=UPI0005A7E241|nr:MULTISPECIES: ATP-dependent RecD-like DNA helicase [unclassified Pseudoalteromonas]